MRLCAVLVLSAAAYVAAPSAAGAAVYCAGDVPAHYGCTTSTGGIQAALDAAGSSAGPDTVRIAGGEHSVSGGLMYDDHGQPDNGVTVAGGGECFRTLCDEVDIVGGSSGATLLSFTGGGSGDVFVHGLTFRPGTGATGLMLPPGARATVQVKGADGSTGVRVAGTEARPVVLWGTIEQPLGGAPDIGVDAVGPAELHVGGIRSDTGVRSRVSQGVVELRDAYVVARTGVSGSGVRVTRSQLDLRPAPGPVVGFESVCESAGAPDAEISAVNVTLRGSHAPGSTGARAIGRGGDGESCDATVRLNSTILHGVATSLDAAGETGSGSDPLDGVARFDMDYSNFDPATVRQSGPAEIDTSSPGENVAGDPRFHPRLDTAALSWDSPLIDRGDPAPVDAQTWEQPVNGRRDIGLREYQFASPHVSILAEPESIVRPRRTVRLRIRTSDGDLDPLRVRVALSNGDAHVFDDVGQVPGPTFTRRYTKLGTYLERATVTDPTGRSASTQLAVTVRRQRMLRFSVRPKRFRASRTRLGLGRAMIRVQTAVPEPVYVRVQRGVPRLRGRVRRWRHATPGPFIIPSTSTGAYVRFNGWADGVRLRPGRYRFVARARGVRPLVARFRILR